MRLLVLMLTAVILPAQALRRVGMLPHIAAGGDWETEITLVNASAAVDLSLTVIFHGSDGSIMALPVSVTANHGNRVDSYPAVTPITASIGPMNALHVVTKPGQPTVVTGWAEVQTIGGDIWGFAIFRQAPPGGPTSECTVPLQAEVRTGARIPFDNLGNYSTGIALINLSSLPSKISIAAWTERGVLVAVEHISLPGSGHRAFVVPDLIKETAGHRGFLSLSGPKRSDGNSGVAGFGLRFSPYGTFTLLPAM